MLLRGESLNFIPRMKPFVRAASGEPEAVEVAYVRYRSKQPKTKDRPLAPHYSEQKTSIVEMCITGYYVMDNPIHSTWKS